MKSLDGTIGSDRRERRLSKLYYMGKYSASIQRTCGFGRKSIVTSGAHYANMWTTNVYLSDVNNGPTICLHRFYENQPKFKLDLTVFYLKKQAFLLYA